MNFVLTNAVLWPFVFLALVPLLLHLFARSKPPAYRFSSIEFIMRIVRQTIRVKRPQDWLLLVIRTLLFTAIILLFLQPLFFSKRRLSGPFERKNVVLLVDATASMAYADGTQTRFAMACAQASEILSGLSARDTANVVWMRARPDSVFPEMGVNFSYLQSALRQARVTTEAGSPAEAMRLAVHLLEGTEGRREICILSDFQRNAWENNSAGVPPGIDLVKVKIGRETGANGAITDIRCDPSKPLVNEDVAIQCEVSNFSPQPRRRTVFLTVQESRQSQDIMIPAWNRATVVFRHKFASAGTFPVSAVLSEDSFSGDDSRWSLVEIRDFFRVGVVPGEPVTARSWQRVLDALGWARTETLAPGDLAGSSPPYDALLLSGTAAPGTNVQDRLRQGCTVVWYPSTNRLDAVWLSQAGSTPVPGARWEQSPRGNKLKVVSGKDELFRLFADGEHGDPSRGKFSGRLVIPASAMEGTDILMAYDDDVPALARSKQGGNFFLWNMPLQPEFSDYASQVEFIPLFAEMLLTARSQPGTSRDLTDFLPGEHISWRFEGDASAADVRLKQANGTAIPVQERRSGHDVVFSSVDGPEPGVYAWEHQGRLLGYDTVNFPTVESDLRALSLVSVETQGAIGVTEGRTVRQLRDGIPLWPYLLTLALALALMEGVALLWVERS